MKTRTALAAIGALVVALLAPASSATAAPPCRGHFEGFVLHGPNEGLALIGELTLAVDDAGNVTGSLKTHVGSTPVTGRIEGQSIHLVFHLSDGLVIEGVGPINKSDFAACAGITEGTLKGPETGDTGNWGIIWGS